MKKIGEIGLKGVITNADPQNQGLPDLAERYWDPMWKSLQDLSLPINFHCGASGWIAGKITPVNLIHFGEFRHILQKYCGLYHLRE